MRYYDLRHIAFTTLLDRGVPIHVVSQVAGHRHITTTQKYLHGSREAGKAAAAILGEVGEVGPVAESVAERTGEASS